MAAEPSALTLWIQSWVTPATAASQIRFQPGPRKSSNRAASHFPGDRNAAHSGSPAQTLGSLRATARRVFASSAQEGLPAAGDFGQASGPFTKSSIGAQSLSDARRPP